MGRNIFWHLRTRAARPSKVCVWETLDRRGQRHRAQGTKATVAAIFRRPLRPDRGTMTVATSQIPAMDLPKCVVRVNWERLVKSPVQRNFSCIHIELEWAMCKASIAEAAGRSCGQKVIWICHGGNLRTRYE